MSEGQPAGEEPAEIAIAAAYQIIMAGLNQVDVKLLEADPFKRKTAWRSAQAIDRALSYLDIALAEVDSAVGKLEPYADSIFQAERAKESAAAAESEARLENSSYDSLVAARIAELARERALLEQEKLEQEKRGAPEGEISFTTAQIVIIKSLEEMLPKDTPISAIGRRQSADGLRSVRKFNSDLAEINDAVHRQLKAILGKLQEVQLRRRKAQARREVLRGGILLGYAILVVVIGVLTDVALGHTKLASLWASFIAASALWAIDRWLISPWIERWSHRQELRDLKVAVAQCVISLMDFVRIGAGLGERAARAGVPEMELLSSKLMKWPHQAADE